MRKLALCLFVLPLALACSSDSGSPTGDDGNDPDLGDFPLGTFTKTLEASDVVGFVPEEDLPLVVGTYRVTYRSDGSFGLSFVGPEATGGVAGTFAVEGNRVTLTETSAGTCQMRGSPSGTYSWSFDGEALSFSLVSDECLKRVAASTIKPFIRE